MPSDPLTLSGSPGSPDRDHHEPKSTPPQRRQIVRRSLVGWLVGELVGQSVAGYLSLCMFVYVAVWIQIRREAHWRLEVGRFTWYPGGYIFEKNKKK